MATSSTTTSLTYSDIPTYSLKNGFYKGLLALIPISITLITYFGLYNVSMWDLLTQYTKPFLASITIGGLATVLLNYIKFSIKQQNITAQVLVNEIASIKASFSPRFVAKYNNELIGGSAVPQSFLVGN